MTPKLEVGMRVKTRGGQGYIVTPDSLTRPGPFTISLNKYDDDLCIKPEFTRAYGYSRFDITAVFEEPDSDEDRENTNYAGKLIWHRD